MTAMARSPSMSGRKWPPRPGATVCFATCLSPPTGVAPRPASEPPNGW